MVVADWPMALDKFELPKGTSSYRVECSGKRLGRRNQMAKGRMSMRNVREVLRLKHQVQLPANQIALSLGMARRTVQEYLGRAEVVDLGWPLPDDLDDAALEARLFPGNLQRSDRPQPDFAWMHEELSNHKHLTLRQLHKEYKQEHPDGYEFSHYCELYRGWLKTLDVSMRQVHLPGDRMFIDFAGDKARVIDGRTGVVIEGHLFVAVSGFVLFGKLARVRLPDMRFLFVGPGLCLRLPSDPTSPWTPLSLANGWYCQPP